MELLALAVGIWFIITQLSEFLKNRKKLSGMFRHGSRSFSPAVHGRLVGHPPRITVVVIRSAAKTAVSQAQTSSKTSCNY
jgi:hypothetical protein